MRAYVLDTEVLVAAFRSDAGASRAAHAFHLSKAVVLATLGRITVQPAVLFALLHLLHVQIHLRERRWSVAAFPSQRSLFYLPPSTRPWKRNRRRRCSSRRCRW